MPCAAFVVSMGKPAGAGSAPPPTVSTIENNKAVHRTAERRYPMKQKKKWMTLMIALALVGSFTLGAKAAGTLESINAYLNYGISIKYNGEPQTLTGADGVRMYPITYNGTTYLPIRAVSNLLGIGVDWDASTQTVLLGDPESDVDLIDSFNAYSLSYATQVQSSEGKTGTIGGVNASHWIAFHGSPAVTGDAHFNLGGKYSSITFQAYSDKDETLIVYGDNSTVLAVIPITGAAAPKSYTVQLKNTTELFFQTTVLPYWNYGYSYSYVFDAKLN